MPKTQKAQGKALNELSIHKYIDLFYFLFHFFISVLVIYIAVIAKIVLLPLH